MATSSNISRRNFLKGASLGAGVPIVGGILAACGTSNAPTAAGTTEMDMSTSQSGDKKTMTADEMDAMHLNGIKQFVEGVKTQGTGNQPLEPKIEGDVKVFELTAAVTKTEATPGQIIDAWTYNGQLPGPELRVTEGDKVRVILHNKLEESTSIHWHGLMIPNGMDGVPGITQDPVKPGQSFTYEFVARNPGSHMYHSHHNSTKQVGKGLLGAFIIEPKNKANDPAYDLEYTLILNDQVGGFTLNGKGFPATAPLKAKLGQKVRIRYMNEGLMIHPMHLHGMPQTVFARDGWNLPQPYKCDTVNIAPGERWDVIVDCTEAGVWAFHCHILSHAEGEHGMFGMVTAMIVE